MHSRNILKYTAKIVKYLQTDATFFFNNIMLVLSNMYTYTFFSLWFRYAPTRRKVADLIDARREKISSLIDSFAVYENLAVKSSKALEFYEKLNTNVGDLQKKVSEAMEENEREKDAVIAKLAPPKPGKYWNKLWNDF